MGRIDFGPLRSVFGRRGRRIRRPYHATVRFRPSKRVIALAAVAGFCLCGPFSALAQRTPDIDPRARRTLDEMVAAYKRLRTLDQETIYSADNTGFSGLTRLRLVVQRPNRLILEATQRMPGFAQPVLTKYHCDGKNYYVYQQTQGYYVRDKAPRDLSGFREIGLNLEMAALTGIHPFAELEKQVRAARMEEPVMVDEVMTDVVLLDIGTAERTGEARLYIGQLDRLLRRFTFESKTIERPAAASPSDTIPPPGSAPPGEDPAQPLPFQQPLRFSYENHVTFNTPLPPDTFRWVPPPGALHYQPLSEMLAPQKRGKSSPRIFFQGKPTDPSKPIRVLTQRDLFEMAKKQKKR